MNDATGPMTVGAASLGLQQRRGLLLGARGWIAVIAVVLVITVGVPVPVKSNSNVPEPEVIPGGMTRWVLGSN